MSDSCVREWCRKFRDGRTDVRDEGGQEQHSVVTDEPVHKFFCCYFVNFIVVAEFFFSFLSIVWRILQSKFNKERTNGAIILLSDSGAFN
jgi:hypothetical protein